jgi:uncharacterized membrane protein
MSDKQYKQALDLKIRELSLQVNLQPPQQPLTLGQKITDKVTSFLGSWSWFNWFTAITVIWLVFNSIKQIAFDPYPYMLYTMVISLWAIYGNIFIQQGGNRIMEQLVWDTKQDSEVNKRSELSLFLLHKKVDLIVDYLKEKQ